MPDLTPELIRVLGGAGRFVSHRDGISTAGAAAQIREHPEMLSDVVLELQALSEALRGRNDPDTADADS